MTEDLTHRELDGFERLGSNTLSARSGEDEEARRLFEAMLGHRTRSGLLSEDMDFETGELWGNFPQTYSLVGIINCAGQLSRSWRDWR